MTTSVSVGPPETEHVPPVGNWLDRLASWFERRGATRPVERMIDLALVLPAATRAQLPVDIAALYETPSQFQLAFAMHATWWSRRLLTLFAFLARQLQVPASAPEHAPLPVHQRLVEDARRRIHWDRYAKVQGRLRRLFSARMAARPGSIEETFVIWGVPLTLRFRATVEDGGMVLRLMRTWSPLSWLLRVEYRTRLSPPGLRTQGSFRIPSLGLRVETRFHAVRLAGERPHP